MAETSETTFTHEEQAKVQGTEAGDPTVITNTVVGREQSPSFLRSILSLVGLGKSDAQRAREAENGRPGVALGKPGKPGDPVTLKGAIGTHS